MANAHVLQPEIPQALVQLPTGFLMNASLITQQRNWENRLIEFCHDRTLLPFLYYFFIYDISLQLCICKPNGYDCKSLGCASLFGGFSSFFFQRAISQLSIPGFSYHCVMSPCIYMRLFVSPVVPSQAAQICRCLCRVAKFDEYDESEMTIFNIAFRVHQRSLKHFESAYGSTCIV